MRLKSLRARQASLAHVFVMNITKPSGRVKVVVATTVMLSFISFWRAAAIVLNDLGSAAFYVGRITQKAVGKSAPRPVLGVLVVSAAGPAPFLGTVNDVPPRQPR